MFLEILYKFLRFFAFWIAAFLVLTLISVVIHWPQISSLIAAQVSAMVSAVFSFLLLMAILLWLTRSMCAC